MNEHTATLLLSSSYLPLGVVPWQRAFTLVFTERADIVQSYDNKYVSTINKKYKVPSVIRYTTGGHRFYLKTRMSKGALLKRDNYRCAYCKKKLNHLTVTKDHVMPSSRGGKDIWENVVCSCFNCNNYKGNRTPEEAGMKIYSVPFKPRHMHSYKIMDDWKPYIIG